MENQRIKNATEITDLKNKIILMANQIAKLNKKVKELSSAMVFSFTFLLFSKYLKAKLDFYYKFIKLRV